jgi:predicted transposase/invertase (TIGR01784 family)
MVKWRRQGEKDIMNEPLHRWLTWFDPNSPTELVTEVVNMDEAIQKADERMVYVTGDKEAIRAYEMHLMRLSDITSWRNTDREEARAEGKAEGKAESIYEIAQKMKEKGVPTAQIAEYTDLPLEAIEKI